MTLIHFFLLVSLEETLEYPSMMMTVTILAPVHECWKPSRYCARYLILIIAFSFIRTLQIAYIIRFLEKKNPMLRVQSKWLIVAQRASRSIKIQMQPYTLSSPSVGSCELTHHLTTVLFPYTFSNPCFSIKRSRLKKKKPVTLTFPTSEVPFYALYNYLFS